MRRVYIDEVNRPTPQSYSIELHSDGSCYMAHHISQRVPDQSTVYDFLIVDMTAAALRLAAAHALANSGTWGQALIDARVLPNDSDQPIALVHERLFNTGGSSIFTAGTEQIENTVQLDHVPPSRHTVDLSAIAADTTEWMKATRMVATDLVQAFGLPEVAQIGPGGELHPLPWGGDFRRYIQWAEQVGLPIER